MKKALILLLSTCLCVLFAGCGNSNPPEENNTEPTSSNQEISDGKTGTGGIAPDFSIDERYHSISSALIDYVGDEAYAEWQQVRQKNFTILEFIEYFKIPKDVFTELVRPELTPEFCESFAPELTLSEIQDMLGYSFSEIDALYSGDQEQINRAFCGPLAFVNDADGEIYSIDWLVEHTPQEYIDAQLPLDQVQAVIDKTASDEFGLYDLAEIAQSKLATVLSLEGAESSSESEAVSSEMGTASPESEETFSKPDADSPESDVISLIQWP